MDAHQPDVPDQFPLFPRDRVSDLARAHLDYAWMLVQARLYLTDSAVDEQYTCLAHERELLIMRTHTERLARDAMAGVVQRPRYGPVPRPPPPPTIARLAG